MQRRLTCLAAAALIVLAGCSKPADKAADASADAAAADASAVPPARARQAAGKTGGLAADASAPEAAKPATPIPAGAPMMAYSYAFDVEAAPSRVRTLEARHEAACAAAGPTVCVVTGSSVSENGKDRVSAQLSLRAAPAWLATFKAALPKDADEAGGRVTRSEVTSEDLSRQIVDTEAALRAKSTLRDRLQQILATRPGKVSELMEVETRLSEVQGAIDTTNSELAMMRQRVATSEVTLDYRSVGVLAPQGVLSPLAQAIGDFLGIVVDTVAVMVRILGVALPWALVLWGLWWLLRRRLPKLRWPFRRQSPPAPPSPGG
ncbi:MAG TPA: DUF4349 domain-containing protein, partial [Caulobacteraceae bacterium]|nr:DUF4349 domain-containing protein [Caulobacteraceae bacterium]